MKSTIVTTLFLIALNSVGLAVTFMLEENSESRITTVYVVLSAVCASLGLFFLFSLQ